MTSQAARQRAMGALGATTDAALSSQLAANLLTGGSAQDAQPQKKLQSAGRLRPSSFDGVRLATLSARQQQPSQRV